MLITTQLTLTALAVPFTDNFRRYSMRQSQLMNGKATIFSLRVLGSTKMADSIRHQRLQWFTMGLRFILNETYTGRPAGVLSPLLHHTLIAYRCDYKTMATPQATATSGFVTLNKLISTFIALAFLASCSQEEVTSQHQYQGLVMGTSWNVSCVSDGTIAPHLLM